MKNSLQLLAVAALLSAAPLAAASAQDKPVKEANKINKKRNKATAAESSLSKSQLKYDAEFATAATSSNLLASALSALAQQKGTALEVKEWGKQMDADHTQLQSQLAAIADQAHIALPKMMSHTDRKIYEGVNDRKYLGFDKKYLRDLQALHQRTIALFADAAQKATNPELRAFAADALPKLREHEAATAQLFDRANERK